MEDNNLSQGLEDTTPETTASEATEPETDGAQSQAAEAEGEGTQAGGEGEGAEGDESQPEASEPTSNESNEANFTVRFNHEDRQITHEEAKRYAQIGMRYESDVSAYENAKSIYDRLDYGASLAGMSIDDFVNAAVSRPEAEHRKHLEEMYGEGSEEVEIGMEIFRKKQKADYQKVIDDRKAEAEKNAEKVKTDVLTRLADEYIELKAEIPDVPEYDKLPGSVIKEAASGKRDLLSAYLRYERAEKIKIAAAKKSEEAAGNATAGKQEGGKDDDGSLADVFAAGVWDR